MRRVIGYCRQSLARAGETAETSLSLESQEQKIEHWAAENALRVHAFYRDHDLKGDNPNRPALKEAIDALRQDDVLAVYDLSRLARDNVLQETIYREIDKRGAVLVSVTEPHATDDLFRGLMGVINQQFRKQLGLRIAAAKDAKARRGESYGRPPIGYKKVDGELVIDEQWAPLVREAFERIAAGDTITAVSTYLAESGFPRRMGVSHFQRMIRRPTYSGGVPHNDEVFWCDGGPCHEPIVPLELQEKAIAMMDGRAHKHPRKNTSDVLLNGSVIHECGQWAYPRIMDGGTSKERIMFACASRSNPPPCATGRHNISQNVLLKALVELLRIDLSSIPDLPDEAVSIAEESYHRIIPDRDEQRSHLTAQRAELDKRRDRAVQIHLDGFKDRGWMMAEIERIEHETAEIDHELATLPEALDTASIRTLVQAKQLHRDHINALSYEQAAQLLGPLGRIQFGPAGISITYNEPYTHLIKQPAVMNWPPHHHYLAKLEREKAHNAAD